jgi:hypothetical protein
MGPGGQDWEDPEVYTPQDEEVGDWSPADDDYADEDGEGDDADDDFFELGEDPMETAGPLQKEETPLAPEEPVEQPSEQPAKGKKGDRSVAVPRADFLAPDDPHQFWGSQSPHIQDALHKYLLPQLKNPNPEIAERAKDILMNGPKIGTYQRKALFEQMMDPKFYEGKSRKKEIEILEKEEGKPPGYLGPPDIEEQRRMREYFDFGGEEKGPVL